MAVVGGHYTRGLALAQWHDGLDRTRLLLRHAMRCGGAAEMVYNTSATSGASAPVSSLMPNETLMGQPARIAWLRAQPYFAVLAERDLSFIAEHTIVRHYNKGEQIFAEGEPCQGLYIVQDGEVRIYKLSPEGREQVLRYFSAGHSFNEVAVFDGGGNPAHASAVSACTLWIIPRDLIFDFVRTRPDMAAAVIQNLGSQLRHLVGLVEDLSLRHISARLAKLLLEVAEEGGEAHRMTQQEMAARLGTVRETVTRALKQLEARGLIEMHQGRIVILDRTALEKII